MNQITVLITYLKDNPNNILVLQDKGYNLLNQKEYETSKEIFQHSSKK